MASKVVSEVKALAEIVASGQRLRLLCWCHPKRCHTHALADTIERVARSQFGKRPPAREFWVPGLREPPVAYYVPQLVPKAEADALLASFLPGIEWLINEKTMNRYTALYGEADEVGEYRYGRSHAAGEAALTEGAEESDLPTAALLPWTPEIRDLKKRAEDWYLRHTGTAVRFTVCLANLYKDGSQGIAWHSDREEIGLETPIASYSFGAERLFELQSKVVSRDRPRDFSSVRLGHGSVMFMENECQELYQHRIGKEPSCDMPRVNLTFRAKPKKVSLLPYMDI